MKIPCQIVFNANEHFPLSEFSGEVNLMPTNTTSFTTLLIEISGTSECEWSFEKTLVKFPRIHRKNKKFTGVDEFFVCRHHLTDDTAETIHLHKGTHTFAFAGHLPRSIPPTWSGQFGQIKYTAKAIIKEGSEYVTLIEREFIVGCNRDLHLERHLSYEARADVTRTFRLGLLNLGKVEVSLWMPICGIAIGQHIPVLCTITNNSVLQFGGLIFVLTRIEVYKSNRPTSMVKMVRTDVCRVPRMVAVLSGKSDYYCVLETTTNDAPTIQSPRTATCQVIYEIWVTLQGAFPRYYGYGYPNIDIKGLPIILGKYPLHSWDTHEISRDVMRTILTPAAMVNLEVTPIDEEVEELLNTAEEEMDEETIVNLSRQVKRKPNVADEEEDEESAI